jgi:Asp-tRNA(Asn)/Glu-tRNA(Gln) amidotransferase A subunit family amidase
MPTTLGSPIYADWRPMADAAIVTLARRAGAGIVGKTATTPFAYGDPAPTRNPRNLAYSPGGSSAGSAAAVAAGMVPLAFGSQTGGSTIRPASFCGVAAIKPSFGLLPTAGLKPYSVSSDTVGLFAASAADLTTALEALTGRVFPRPEGRIRVGVTRQDFAGEADADAQHALAAAAGSLEAAGVEVVDLDDPPEFRAAWEMHATLCDAEAFQALGWEWENRRAQLPPMLEAALAQASRITPAEVDQARRSGKAARCAARAFFDDITAAITFSAPGIAPKGFASTGDARFNRLWSFLKGPCVNVARWAGREDMPIGIQVVALPGHDAAALAVAEILESAPDA